MITPRKRANRPSAPASDNTPTVADTKRANAIATARQRDDAEVAAGHVARVHAYDTAEPLEQLIAAKTCNAVRRMREYMSNAQWVAEKGDPATNIINNAEKKSYVLPEHAIEEFFMRLEACRLAPGGRALHYAERQDNATTAHSGIMIDLDVYQRVHKQLVTEGHISRIVSSISGLLRKTLDFQPDCAVFNLHVFVIARPQITQEREGVFKDGYHIIIPDVQTTRAYKMYLVSEMQRMELFPKIFKDIAADLVDPASVLDKMSARVPVNFIGSAKATTNVAYPLKYAYGVEIDLDNEFMANLQTIDVDVLNEGTLPDGGKINLCYELALGFYAPTIGGHYTWLLKQQYDHADAIDDKIHTFAEKRHADIINEDEIAENDNEVDALAVVNAEAHHLKQLLQILDLDYATSYDKWFKVICAIANTSVRYKPLAVWFSHRNPKSWSAAEIDRVWDEALRRRADQDPLTKRSLIYWASQCAPDRFAEIDRTNYNQILARSVYTNDGEIPEADVARLIYAMIGDKFVCDVPRGDKLGRTRAWYEFILPEQHHRPGEVYKWRREDDPDMLCRFISTQLPIVYTDQITRLDERIAEAADEAEQKYLAGVRKKLKISRRKLGEDAFQRKVVSQCRIPFRMRGFCEELDSAPLLLGVGNGVLELGANPRLIQGFHEHKISRYTRTCWRPYNPNCPLTRELEGIVADIIVEPDAREWLMLNLSTFLDRCEVSGILLIIRGNGRNGKTWVFKMTQETLGDDNVCQFRSELLVGPEEKANEANSAKMMLAGKTGGFCDEFNSTDCFNTKRLKSMINPARQNGRELFATESNFKNTANLFALSNYNININDVDYGSWRRLRALVAKTKFCENPNPNNPHEKRVNHAYMDVYPNDQAYREAWLSILVHYHQRLHSEYGGDIKNVPSPTIDAETEQYRDQQNALNRFINQMVVRSPQSPDLALDKIALAYIEWHNKYVGKTVIKVESITSQLGESKLTPYMNLLQNNVQMLVGHRILDTPDEHLEEGEEYLHGRIGADEFVQVRAHAVADGAEPDDADSRTDATEYTEEDEEYTDEASDAQSDTNTDATASDMDTDDEDVDTDDDTPSSVVAPIPAYENVIISMRVPAGTRELVFAAFPEFDGAVVVPVNPATNYLCTGANSRTSPTARTRVSPRPVASAQPLVLARAPANKCASPRTVVNKRESPRAGAKPPANPRESPRARVNAVAPVETPVDAAELTRAADYNMPIRVVSLRRTAHASARKLANERAVAAAREKARVAALMKNGWTREQIAAASPVAARIAEIDA